MRRGTTAIADGFPPTQAVKIRRRVHDAASYFPTLHLKFVEIRNRPDVGTLVLGEFTARGSQPALRRLESRRDGRPQ